MPFNEDDIVVSRGYDRGLENMRIFDEPKVSTTRAFEAMGMDDTVTARPSIEELQAANLRAVRAREARDMAARQATPRIAARAKPKTSGMSDSEIRSFMRANDSTSERPTTSRSSGASRSTAATRKDSSPARSEKSILRGIADGLEALNKKRPTASEVIRDRAAKAKPAQTQARRSNAVDSRVGIMQQRPPSLIAARAKPNKK